MDDRRMYPKVIEDGKKDQQIAQKGDKEAQEKLPGEGAGTERGGIAWWHSKQLIIHTS